MGAKESAFALFYCVAIPRNKGTLYTSIAISLFILLANTLMDLKSTFFNDVKYVIVLNLNMRERFLLFLSFFFFPPFIQTIDVTSQT